MSITIGISKGYGSVKMARYAEWLRSADPDVTTIDLTDSADPDADLARIDALLLTGGSDIDPARYGQPELESKCSDIDRARDTLELRALEIAEEREIPVLAICRGLQLVNVYFGGTLHPHLPDVLEGSVVHEKVDGNDNVHDIEITPGTLLYRVAGDIVAHVNSAHHQGIGELGAGLEVSAKSPDGTIEGIERKNRSGKSFLVGVQWHPERMLDQESRMSKGIRELFLFEARSAQILARTSKPLPKPDPEVAAGNQPDVEDAGNGAGLFPIIP